MMPNLILFEPEQVSCQLIERHLAQAGLTAKTVMTPAELLQCIHRDHYEGVLLDCDAVAVDEQLIGSLRQAPTSRAAVIIAMAADKHLRQMAFQAGATFLLEKPLTSESVLHCLHAAYGLLCYQQRRYSRHRLEGFVHLSLQGCEGVQGSLINLSAGGMCLSMPVSLPEHAQGGFEFEAEALSGKVAGSCQLCWAKDGRCGFRFLQMTRESLVCLNDWLERVSVLEEWVPGGKPLTDVSRSLL